MNVGIDPHQDCTSLIDHERIGRTFGDDPELIGLCAGTFCDSYSGMLDEIERAIAAQDGGELRHAAHAFCGVVGSFSTSQPYRLGRQLEGIGQAGSLRGAVELLSCLRASTICLADELRRLSMAQVSANC